MSSATGSITRGGSDEATHAEDQQLLRSAEACGELYRAGYAIGREGLAALSDALGLRTRRGNPRGPRSWSQDQVNQVIAALRFCDERALNPQSLAKLLQGDGLDQIQAIALHDQKPLAGAAA